MKVGIKKIHEDEWWVEVGCAVIRLNYLQVHLLNIVLKEVVHLDGGDDYNLLRGFLTLLDKLQYLSDEDLQQLLRQVNDQDLVLALKAMENEALRARILQNVGPLLAKQLAQDLQSGDSPAPETVINAIERIMRRAFEMEAKGEIEFQTEVTEYI